MEKFEVNPFSRSALTDYRLLAGRKYEFTQIRFILRNAANQQNRTKSILITGDRGVGKTSFLNLIENECPSNNLIAIRMDLTERNSSNSNEFFWYLFSQLTYKLFTLKFFEGIGGLIDTAIQKILYSDGVNDPINFVFRTPILRKIYLHNPNITFEFNQLVEDLKLIRKEISESCKDQFNEKTKIYFLIDESQYIYSNSQIIEDIRYIIQNQDIGFGFIFAGDTSYISSKWETIFGGSYREFEIINLNYFSEVESVIEYFKKSLESIGWTNDEIETTLFYRFKLACRQIFYVTSGKPAWINIVASKMFERCMKKETPMLRFDRQAQNDVKKILEDSGQIERIKLDFIESLPPIFNKWLAFIFSCELSTFEEVYFYAKFNLYGENYIDLDTYTRFCKDLIFHGILCIQEKKPNPIIGYKSSSNNEMFLKERFIAFGYNEDTIKQWLQINTEGKFSFGLESPDIKFINSINQQLLNDKCNTIIISTRFTPKDQGFRFVSVLNNIKNGEYSISDELYYTVENTYKLIKKLSNSRDRQVLFVVLTDLNSDKIRTWNVYNYDDHGKLLHFNDSPVKLKKLIFSVNNYKSENHNYEFDLQIDNIDKMDIELFQNLIIKSKDTKKIGIIIDDKLHDLVEYYVKESDVESSYKAALFFYKLYEDGHDLNLSVLNNSAYVFIAKNEIEKAQYFLSEAKRKINFENLEIEDINTACLVLYNLAILFVKMNNLESALTAFNDVIDFIYYHEQIDSTASVLNSLQIDVNNKIEIIEIKEGEKSVARICSKTLALDNIKILEKLISK